MSEAVLIGAEKTENMVGIINKAVGVRGACHALFSGKLVDGMLYIQREQLKDKALWAKLVSQFGRNSDGGDRGWRGEYWGKMMRGACMTYAHTQDAELYEILRETTAELLEKQDMLGRISTYDPAGEFRGWDLWSRKYVLTGLLFFYSICQDEGFKARIMSAMRRHADYIVSKVGSKPEQISIVETSDCWGSTNSCSILEAFVMLYKLTNEPRYLEFSSYIVSSGGSKNGNLIEIALENKKKPHEYPVVKAYETMSFFAGLLEYYGVTGEKKYFIAAENFVQAVLQHEITVIGCAGCTHELFDNSAVMQTEHSEREMQETCVTVTWMLLCNKMLELTGDAVYAECIEKSAYNALLGSVNFEKNKCFNIIDKHYVAPMPFDSYSPLYLSKRGKAVGGYKEFDDGGFYGCCASIGSAGTALVPLTAAVKTAAGVEFRYYLNGKIVVPAAVGETVFDIKTGYPSADNVKITVEETIDEPFEIKFRVPKFAVGARVSVNGVAIDVLAGGYHAVSRQWKSGDCIELSWQQTLRIIKHNGKAAFFYGPLTLCRDLGKENGIKDAILIDVVPESLTFTRLPEKEKEQIRLSVEVGGNQKILLTDYQSCGRDWWAKDAVISVWTPFKEGD